MLSPRVRRTRSRISLYGCTVAAKGDHLSRLASAPSQIFRFTILAALVAAISAPTFARGRRSGRPGRVQTGLDVLEAEKFPPLRGNHVGPITNHTRLDSQAPAPIHLL